MFTDYYCQILKNTSTRQCRKNQNVSVLYENQLLLLKPKNIIYRSLGTSKYIKISI